MPHYSCSGQRFMSLHSSLLFVKIIYKAFKSIRSTSPSTLAGLLGVNPPQDQSLLNHAGEPSLQPRAGPATGLGIQVTVASELPKVAMEMHRWSFLGCQKRSARGQLAAGPGQWLFPSCQHW